MKKNLFILPLLFIMHLHASEIFETTYSFKNVSINYLDWTSKTQNSTSKEDFAYLELEGGAGFSWGEFYMFLDIENPTKSYSDEPAGNLRVTFKPVLNITLVDELSLYMQVFNLQSKDFYVTNPVLGLAYKIKANSNFWIRPFVALNYEESTYYSGLNGYMAGWVFMYKFALNKQKFSLSQWNQHTFSRDDGNIGTQGALAFWWHPMSEITTGIQYRYAAYELGNDEYQDGLIYTLKYNF